MILKTYKNNVSDIIKLLIESSSKSIFDAYFLADKDRLFSPPNMEEIKNLHYWYNLKSDKLFCFPSKPPQWLYQTKKQDETSDYNLGLKLYGNEKEPNQLENLVNNLNQTNNCLSNSIYFNPDYCCYYIIDDEKLYVNVLKSSCEATEEYCRDYYWNKLVAEKIIDCFNLNFNKTITLEDIIFQVDKLYLNPENYNLATQYQTEFNFLK